MQVTDIDPGTSLSIQALEERVFFLQKKNTSEEHAQYSERHEMPTSRSHKATRE